MIEKTLNEIEVRVLGSLIEKELTTPDYYPLTLNALTNACNQKSNRDPVVSFDETTIVRTLEVLKEKKGLVGTISGAGIRYQKYRHNFTAVYDLNKKEAAILCELMLRGPQTLGELRSRAERMCDFESISEVELIIDRLVNRENIPLVVKLPRQSGQKESRFMHLLSGEPKIEEIEAVQKRENAVIQVLAENERIAKLEELAQNQQKEIEDLRKEFLDFKRQFE